MGRRQKRKLKTAYFNPDKDQEIIEYANRLENFSEWVKTQLRKEIQARQNGVDQGLVELVERLLESKLAGRVITLAGQTDQSEEYINSDLDAFF